MLAEVRVVLDVGTGTGLVLQGGARDELWIWDRLGLVRQVLRGDWVAAMPSFWSAFDIVERRADAIDLYTRAEVHRHVGFDFLAEASDLPEAVAHLSASLDLRRQLGDRRRTPSGLQALAEAHLAAGDKSQAAELLEQALAEGRRAGLGADRLLDIAETLNRLHAGP